MKGTEFKPTNLVYNADGVVCTVDLVKESTIIARNHNNNRDKVIVNLEEAVPIELSERVLQGAGFAKTTQERLGGAERWILERDTGRWYIDFDGKIAYFEVQGRNIKIKYLHHLQCLFMDLGDALKVELSNERK